MPASYDVQTPHAVVLLGATPRSPYVSQTLLFRADHPSPSNWFSRFYNGGRLVHAMLLVEVCPTEDLSRLFAMVMSRVPYM